MLDKIIYHYYNNNHQKCLECSEEYLEQDPKNALEYAMMASFK